MANERIIDLPSASISDNSLGFIGDPLTGALSQSSYHAMKDYFTAGITLSGYVTTASYNPFSSSYVVDSASFNTRINNAAGTAIYNNDGTLTIAPHSGSAVTASLALGHANTWTGAQSFNTATASFGLGIQLPASSESGAGGRDAAIYNNNLGVDGLADITVRASTGTNSGVAFDIVPVGSGYVGSLRTILRVYNTDNVADPVNVEYLALRSQGTNSPGYTIYTDKGGSGTARALGLSSGNTGAQLFLNTTGRTSINSINDDGTGLLQVYGNTYQLALHYGTTTAVGAYFLCGIDGTLTINPNGIKTIFQASTAASASIQIPSGSTPAHPALNGDIWLDATGSLKITINGVVKTFTLT
jgi:hypothetical protein